MREILFRGKSKVTGEGVQGDLFRYSEQLFIAAGNHNTEILPETLGQYTGLKDNNGVMAWESDIVDYEDESPGQYEYHDSLFINRGVIEFSEGCFYFTNSVAANLQDYVYKGVLDCIVVGNIHDDPELLKGE